MTAARAWLGVVIGLLGGCASDYQTFEPPPLELAVERITIDSGAAVSWTAMTIRG